MMQPSNGLGYRTALVASHGDRDLNSGRIKWQVPDGGVVGVPQDTPTGAHFPRGGVVVTGGGVIFVATTSDHQVPATIRTMGRCSGNSISRQVPMACLRCMRSPAASMWRFPWVGRGRLLRAQRALKRFLPVPAAIWRSRCRRSSPLHHCRGSAGIKPIRFQPAPFVTSMTSAT